MRGRKYRNVKTEADGILFDSKAEAQRWLELRILEHSGMITRLRRQVPFVLIKGTVWSDGKKHRDTKYIADFYYIDEDGRIVVEDVKGYRTAVYKLKREIMKDVYGIEIKEVKP